MKIVVIKAVDDLVYPENSAISGRTVNVEVVENFEFSNFEYAHDSLRLLTTVIEQDGNEPDIEKHEFIEPSETHDWLIDKFGRKRVPQMHIGSEWPLLNCRLDDELILVDDLWVLRTDAMRFTSLKAEMLAGIIPAANKFTARLEARYPSIVQKGFDKKEAEARAIKSVSDASGDVDAAIAAALLIKNLATLSQMNNADVVTLCESIIAKAEEFSQITVAVECMQNVSFAAITAVPDGDLSALIAVREQLYTQAQALAAQHGLA